MSDFFAFLNKLYLCAMQNFYNLLNSSLKEFYSKSEIRIFRNIILEKITGLNPTQLLTDKDRLLTPDENERAVEMLHRLKNSEPIQYILGETEFFGLKFKVNSNVLIPRPETEELVEWVSNDLKLAGKELSKVRILDIGTGSGCIPIALKSKHSNSKVTAMDVSEKALEVARDNAKINAVEIEFTHEDILNPSQNDRKWDVIISNPPYIPQEEIAGIEKNVKDFEPHIALFVPNDEPLLFYKKIASYAHHHLAPEGKLYFETHKDLANEVASLLINAGFQNIEIRKDMSGNERMVRGDL